METGLYYTAPKKELFDEVKNTSMALWKEIDGDNDRYGYATAKIDSIKDMENVSDNFMYMVAMFDVFNQAKLAKKLSPESRQAIRDRMIEGKNPEYVIPF